MIVRHFFNVWVFIRIRLDPGLLKSRIWIRNKSFQIHNTDNYYRIFYFSVQWILICIGSGSAYVNTAQDKIEAKGVRFNTSKKIPYCAIIFWSLKKISLKKFFFSLTIFNYFFTIDKHNPVSGSKLG